MDSFANINIFPLMNLELTLMLDDLLITIDLMLAELFSSKSIIVLIFLSCSIEFFLSLKSSLTFLFLNLFSFFLRHSNASKFSSFLFVISLILIFLNGSLSFISLNS